eukprot:2081643-Alexandrium_andersonii.AAC.1
MGWPPRVPSPLPTGNVWSRESQSPGAQRQRHLAQHTSEARRGNALPFATPFWVGGGSASGAWEG